MAAYVETTGDRMMTALHKIEQLVIDQVNREIDPENEILLRELERLCRRIEELKQRQATRQ